MSGSREATYRYQFLTNLKAEALLSQLPNLLALNLSQNKLDDVPKGLPLTLIALDLSCNLLTSIKDSKKLSNLIELKLSNNMIVSTAGLSFAVSLEYLDLSKNQLKIVAGLESLKHLRDLNLEKNLITKIAALRSLSLNRKLTDLVLLENPLCLLPNYKTSVLSFAVSLKKLDRKLIKNQINTSDQTYLAGHFGSMTMCLLTGKPDVSVGTIQTSMNSPPPSPSMRSKIPWRNPPCLAPRNRRSHSVSLPDTSMHTVGGLSDTDSRFILLPTAAPSLSSPSSSCPSPYHWSIPLLNRDEAKTFKLFKRELPFRKPQQSDQENDSKSWPGTGNVAKQCPFSLPRGQELRRGVGREGGQAQSPSLSCSRSFLTTSDEASLDDGIYRDGRVEDTMDLDANADMDTDMDTGYGNEYTQRKSRNGYDMFRKLSNNFQSAIDGDVEETQSRREKDTQISCESYYDRDHDVSASFCTRGQKDNFDVETNWAEIQNLQRSLQSNSWKDKVHRTHGPHKASQATPLPITLQNRSSVLRAVLSAECRRRQSRVEEVQQRHPRPLISGLSNLEEWNHFNPSSGHSEGEGRSHVVTADEEHLGMKNILSKQELAPWATQGISKEDGKDEDEAYDNCMASSIRTSTGTAKGIGVGRVGTGDTNIYSNHEDELVHRREAVSSSRLSGFKEYTQQRGGDAIAVRTGLSNANLKQYISSVLNRESRLPRPPPPPSPPIACVDTCTDITMDMDVDVDRIEQILSMTRSPSSFSSPSPFRDLKVNVSDNRRIRGEVEAAKEKEKEMAKEREEKRLQFDSSGNSTYIDASTSAEVHELRELIRKMTERKIESIRLMHTAHPHSSPSLPSTVH